MGRDASSTSYASYGHIVMHKNNVMLKTHVEFWHPRCVVYKWYMKTCAVFFGSQNEK